MNTEIIARNTDIAVDTNKVLPVKFESGQMTGFKTEPTLSISAVFAGLQSGLGGSDRGYIKRALVKIGLIMDTELRSFIPTDKLKPYCIGSSVVGTKYIEVMSEFGAEFISALQRVRLDDELATKQAIRSLIIDDFIEENGRVPGAKDMRKIELIVSQEMVEAMKRNKESKYENRIV